MGYKTQGLRSKTSSPLKLKFYISNCPLLALSLISVFLLSGCSPFYVLQAAYEQGKILWRRESIERVLQKPDLDSETKEKLKLVLAVREYAGESLGLRVGGSYASYSYVDRPVVSYVLMAAPKTDLDPYTWWFLFVGRVPYKGFFSEQAAKTEAESLHAQGYDTYVRTAPAYSTLGWFDDPLLKHLLRYDKITLAEVIFHELLHSTLFVKGAVDFNESLANFVGNRAAILFFRDRYGEGSPEHLRANQAWEEELEFSLFIAEMVRSLRDLYGKKDVAEEEKLRLREEIFSRSQKEWSRRIESRPAHQYRGFGKQNVNNAVIAHYLLYVKDLALFESLYQARGKDLPRLLELIEKSIPNSSNPFDAVRELLHKRE
ncbi:MAG: aminopeptidase [Candidatus Binatia bacterium]